MFHWFAPLLAVWPAHNHYYPYYSALIWQRHGHFVWFHIFTCLASLCLLQAQLMLGLVTPQMVCSVETLLYFISWTFHFSCLFVITFLPWTCDCYRTVFNDLSNSQLQMPNIRQSSVPPPQSILLDSHRNQQLAARTLPGLPPPHSSLAQTQPQVQLPQSAENNILQHGRLPIHSGVQTIPSIRPQGNLTATLPIQVGTSTSSSLKQQMHHPFLPQAGLVPSAKLPYTSQPAAPNAAFQPSLACPPSTEKVFQVTIFT